MDPSELDEAAIRFARGDFAGAEQALRQALDRSSARGESAQDLWLTLFDLYRATGQSERFDVLALDFAR
ncbi:MAG: hypothetical protein PHI55_14775, partial [Burkholderiaceae bacterium]|nr:hypothetical protein [Burkholderiaceae bacterium]